MTTKIKISLIFMVIIFLSTGYFLWQIDKYEKATLGQGWINEVPHATWQKYLSDRAAFEKSKTDFIKQNPHIFDVIEKYKFKNLKVEKREAYLSMRLDHIMSSLDVFLFKNEHPEEYKKFRDFALDLIFKEPSEPKPSNPPRPIIHQSINSFYRYMIAVDSLLILGLVVFLYLYKEEKTTAQHDPTAKELSS